MSDAGRLAGKVALVTGAAGFIGRQTVLRFAAEGARVACCDIDDESGRDVVDRVRDAGGDAFYEHTDVSKGADWEALVARTEAEFGALHVVFNNAGISHIDDAGAVDTDEEVWDLTMAINLKGVYLGCRHTIPALRRAGGGSIINMASFVALMGAATPQLAYTASKGGVLALSRELAVLHAREKIRVNALCPGPQNSELLMKYLDTPERRQRRLVHIPMGRFGEAEEIANAALFLASEESSYMTGASFTVDGGVTAAYVTPEDS
jgi:NAD(P)-dependent dehydrogenase (short-subunit alcohol dehydrogenase family)